MQFSKRMERFGQGIFASLLAEKRRLLQEGREVVDLSVGTPNIPPAQHVIDALCAAAADPQSYVYAIQDTDELKEAAAAWYRRRYGVILDPQREVASLLGSRRGYPILLCPLWTMAMWCWYRIPAIRSLGMAPP